MFTRRRIIRLLTIPAAALAALVVWLIEVPVLGTELEAVTGTGSAITVGAVVTAVVAGFAAIPAWLVLAAFEKWTRHPVRWFVITAAAFLVVSLAGPLGGTSPAAVAGLAALHVVTAVTVTGVLLASRAVGASADAAPAERAVAYGDGR
ncbi:DUF6069 family protein [Microbacterium immunditiarum]|uniref:CBS domain containing-hemolysin-like protein n=1 Tax=Microbacterium immunditiarum TaxID=337480 RepID=A0A7Y9GRW8_9MICO|nr:DUF6069 family protein [Microbacterium immunditiarum]NYE21387.1 CBS domain containing-hemolysin-like protein [Microbacterium immunditiarum]